MANSPFVVTIRIRGRNLRRLLLFLRKTDPTSNLLGALKVSQLFTHRVSPIRQSSASAAVPSKTTAGTIGYPIADGGADRRQHHPQGC